MAIPQYVGRGTPYIGLSNTTGFVTFPADVSTSDLAILWMDGAAVPTCTPGAAFSFSLCVDAAIGFGTGRLFVRICDGTEDGASLTMVQTGASGRRAAAIYTFRGTPGGTWGFDINGATVGNWVSRADGLGSTANAQGISVSTAECLILNFVGLGKQQQTLSYSGAGGGVWTVQDLWDKSTGAVPALALLTCSLTSSGSITGGAAGLSVTTQVMVFGTGLFCTAGGAVPQTVTAGGLAVGVGFGGAPIICPVGFIPHPAFLPQTASYARTLWPW